MTSVAPAPKLLTRLRQAIRLHQYSPRTEQAYVGWVRRFGVERTVVSVSPGAGVRSRWSGDRAAGEAGSIARSLLEALQLRVKDVDFSAGEIVVRRGKGAKDRITMLPESLHQQLKTQLEWVRRQHQRDSVGGGGCAPLPGAFHRKSPGAAREWGWQFVLPATRRYLDRVSGVWYRHHLHESAIQRAVKQAVFSPFLCDASAGGWL